MPGLTAIIIALLLSLGIISSPADLNDLTAEQETEIEIIINDDLGI